jgi:hypothetical protein
VIAFFKGHHQRAVGLHDFIVAGCRCWLALRTERDGRCCREDQCENEITFHINHLWTRMVPDGRHCSSARFVNAVRPHAGLIVPSCVTA